MVTKSQYYAHTNNIPLHVCAPIDNGTGPQLVGPHAAAILAIPDNDPGFIAWLAERHFARLEAALDDHLEQIAVAKEYGTARVSARASAIGYAGYSNAWQVECLKYAAWVEACYLNAQQIMGEVLGGQRAIPTEAELLAEMPPMEW